MTVFKKQHQCEQCSRLSHRLTTEWSSSAPQQRFTCSHSDSHSAICLALLRGQSWFCPTSPGVILLAPQVRFNSHSLGSQFPLVINPAQHRSCQQKSHTHLTGLNVHQEIQTNRGLVVHWLIGACDLVCIQTICRMQRWVFVRWHDENID